MNVNSSEHITSGLSMLILNKVSIMFFENLEIIKTPSYIYKNEKY